MRVVTGVPVHLFIRDARGGRPQSIAKVARTLEEAGYWGIGLPDHILSAGVAHVGHDREENPGWRYADIFAMMAYLAAVTTTIRIVPRVIVVPYRNPFATAHALATIDSLSGGRLVAGLAPGYEESEFRILGVPKKQRGPITDEYITIMRLLWTLDHVTFKGRYHAFEDATLLVKPVQEPHPPIWIGGNSEAALRRAVASGDGWTPNCFLYPEVDAGVANSRNRERLIEGIRWSREQRRAAGRPDLEYAVSSGPPVTILERSKRSAPRPRSAIDRFSCEGTPAELLEEYQVFKEAGADSFIVNFTGNTIEEYLKDATTFAREVMPHLD